MSDRRNEVFTGPAAPGAPRRDVMREDFHYEIPTATVPVPSGGKIYASDSGMGGLQTISIRSMTAREEDILTSRALIKKGTVINELLRSCIVSPGVDPDKMIAGDRNAVMISLRITGYGPNYSAEIHCEDCGEKVEAEFDLSALKIKELTLEPVQVGQNLFEFVLPVTKKKVQFKYLTGEDERDLIAETEKKKKLGSAGDNLVTSKLQRAVVSIDTITEKSKIGMFIRSMPAGDSRALRKFMEENEPGIDMKCWVTCPQCSASQEVEMPIGLKFFWPDG